MNNNFKNYLFTKHILVNDTADNDATALSVVFALAKLFNIKVTEGHLLATVDMLKTASSNLGERVSEPFYLGFPDTVKKMYSDELLFDQLLHYATTYGMDDFSQPGHSRFEEDFTRAAFNEKLPLVSFRIVNETDGITLLSESITDLLGGTRPLSDYQYDFLKAFLKAYPYVIKSCPCKATLIRLTVDDRDAKYVPLLNLSDLIKIAELINYQAYNNPDIKQLNLRNKDRVFITKLLDALLASDKCNVKECYEKKAIWSGLLHHIHYIPKTEKGKQFVQAMRGKTNASVFSSFEKELAQGNIQNAVLCLKKGKGSGALLRNLNYILSRCKDENDTLYVLSQVKTSNPIMLLQLLFQYATYEAVDGRSFKFSKFNKLAVHKETEEEKARRKSVVPKDVIDVLIKLIKDNLSSLFANRLGSVYIDKAMKNCAVPIHADTSSGGYGVLCSGTRIPIDFSKKIRAFTYWENVDDIDLSVIGLRENGTQEEFSWRCMYEKQNNGIVFSGDQTSGRLGGAEYFDINLNRFIKKYPDIRYLVFCDNVYSMVDFSDCYCKAGYMLRNIHDSGKVFEPKTVKSSFEIKCKSTFAYLFGIDLAAKDFVWLNISRADSVSVAGTTALGFLRNTFNSTYVFNLYEFFTMLATKVVTSPQNADVVVSDDYQPSDKEQTIIHSYDFDKIIALLNNAD